MSATISAPTSVLHPIHALLEDHLALVVHLGLLRRRSAAPESPAPATRQAPAVYTRWPLRTAARRGPVAKAGPEDSEPADVAGKPHPARPKIKLQFRAAETKGIRQHARHGGGRLS